MRSHTRLGRRLSPTAGVVALLCLLLVRPAAAAVTLANVRDLTTTTWDMCAHVDASCSAARAAAPEQVPPLKRPRLTAAVQQTLALAQDDDVEHTIAASLHMVNAKILGHLNTPAVQRASSECGGILADYHQFVSATIHFLHAISEKQQVNHWNVTSTVFDEVGFMQALWASRRTNVLHRSFIEQQMDLYGPTLCFTDDNKNEVLYRGVEIVEFLNDMIDSFP